LSKDELEGKGLFVGCKAKGDRRQQLEGQIEVWEALVEKLGEIDSE
jgi:hypothetical protein